MSRLGLLSNLDEERRRRRVTHLEGMRPPQPTGPAATGGAEGGGSSVSGTGGGVAGAGGVMPTVEVEPVLDAESAFDVLDPRAARAEGRAADPHGTSGPNDDPQFRIWSTFKMFEDEELQRQQDILEMLKRIREAAQLDEQRVRDWLNANPELRDKLNQAVLPIARTAPAGGWNLPSGPASGGSGGIVSDGAGGFFV